MRLKIKKETVVKMFVGLGFKTADTWDEEKLLKKVKQLPDILDDSKIDGIEDPKIERILESVLDADEIIFKEEGEPESSNEEVSNEETEEEDTDEEAIEEEDEDEVEDTEPEENEPESEKPETKQPTKKTKKGIGKDAFGRRLGSQGALIDEHISNEGKTIKEIAEATGLPNGRVSTHLRDLLSKGFLKRDDNGKYSIHVVEVEK